MNEDLDDQYFATLPVKSHESAKVFKFEIIGSQVFNSYHFAREFKNMILTSP